MNADYPIKQVRGEDGQAGMGENVMLGPGTSRPSRCISTHSLAFSRTLTARRSTHASGEGPNANDPLVNGFIPEQVDGEESRRLCHFVAF